MPYSMLKGTREGKEENCPGGGNVRGNMSEGICPGGMSGSR